MKKSVLMKGERSKEGMEKREKEIKNGGKGRKESVFSSFRFRLYVVRDLVFECLVLMIW